MVSEGRRQDSDISKVDETVLHCIDQRLLKLRSLLLTIEQSALSIA